MYGNELDKARFAHNAAYSDSKDLDRAYQIDRNFNYEGYRF